MVFTRTGVLGLALGKQLPHRCLTYHNLARVDCLTKHILTKHIQGSSTGNHQVRHITTSVVRMGASVSSQDSPALQQFIKGQVSDNCVTVFSKTTCGFCKRTKRLLDELEVQYKSIELDKREDGRQIQQELSLMTGSSTVPSVFVNGQYVGGSDDTNRLHKEGKLLELVMACKL